MTARPATLSPSAASDVTTPRAAATGSRANAASFRSMPVTIGQVSEALRGADLFVLPPFPDHRASSMSYPSIVERLGCQHMQAAAKLAQEIMTRAAREAAICCGVKPDDMIETIQADCEHMLEACEAEFRSKADKMREQG